MFKTTQFNRAVIAAAVIMSIAATASAALVPYTENFAADAAAWRDAAGAASLSWNSTGGPDGSAFVSAPFSFAASGTGSTPAIFRGHEDYGSSSGAFVGNWLAGGVTGFSVWVRHDAPESLTFFARYAKPVIGANPPTGAASLGSFTVAPNTWTKLDFTIAFGAPGLFLEGPPTSAYFNTVFSDIRNVQVGVSTPSGLASTAATYTFDMDQPSLLPEPASASMVLLAGLALLLKRRGRVI